MRAGLHAGQLLLVHGGGSGIGTHAIQVATNRGARVAVTAGSQYKLDRCLELGASVGINYREQDFVEIVGELGGADIILDNMGAAYLGRNVRALADDGQLCIIGMQGGVKGELVLPELLGKRGTIHAPNLRKRPATGRSSTAEIIAEERALYPAFLAAATVARDRDLAEAIVLTGSVMSWLAEPLGRDLGIPVVIGLTAAVNFATSAVRLGLRTSRAFTHRRPVKHDRLRGYPDLQGVYGHVAAA